MQYESHIGLFDACQGRFTKLFNVLHSQYKLKESPIPSDEEESSEESSDDEFGPKKPKVDPDDPVARELFKELKEKYIIQLF